jgi:CHAT domain-containing protein
VLREDASGLVLADGLLTAQDLAFRTHLPRLLVANACHSAATGDVRLQEQAEASRATRNLVSGVLGAGARAFVGAMWEVDDQAAATFAAGLYTELVRTGEAGGGSIGDAVRRGRQQIIAAHGEHQPAWAAYALYGSPWRPAW